MNHSAQYTDLLRQFHAQHPKGTSLRELGHKVFGHARDGLPTYQQALALHDWMLRTNWKKGQPLPKASQLISRAEDHR